MDISEKLEILTGAAKYDVACTSSGTERSGERGKLGNAVNSGICHSFAADGRCISLLKVLFTNDCIYDCKYCINRYSNDVPRATFTPEEIATLTINFYKRNYIEGLFLSSAVIKNPDYTMEMLYQTVKIVREVYRFNGYIHVKAIPGASPELLYKVGILVDRMSVNIELPSEKSLKILAPQKSRDSIVKPMGLIRNKIIESKDTKLMIRSAPEFVPGGQATQMIIGASKDTDFDIIRLSEALYNNYKLKRVFYSAYTPISDNPLLPALVKPPMLREHRLYQADWLLRFYGFTSSEILDEGNQDLNLLIDPKCDWAIRNIDKFPVEINKADYFSLLRVPGIGLRSAKRIIESRKFCKLDYDSIKKFGVVMKRARFFITCNGKRLDEYKISEKNIIANILAEGKNSYVKETGVPYMQNNFLNESFEPVRADIFKSLTGEL
jgi:putative DNA modification/repair radical SAM protein